MLSNFENYIFDLDGTIVNSSKEILKCLNLAFQDAGCNIPVERFSPSLIGPPIRQIIENIAPEIKDEKIIKDIILSFRQYYDYDIDDCSVLYPKIKEYLNFLQSSKKKLYIATFKTKIPTSRIVRMFNLDMFNGVYTVDYPKMFPSKNEMVEYLLKEENLKRDRTIMIGDSVSDILAGKSNNIATAGVLWGYGKDKSQIITQADLTIGVVEDLNLAMRMLKDGEYI